MIAIGTARRRMLQPIERRLSRQRRAAPPPCRQFAQERR